ncbi:hypothetical protein MYX76_04810 [Desulfobacterota bacterium AH_259_B03_O07]|nr:hypothetical protein [Desulfobacterota bacterium AH_259_B03_O07]
MEKYIDNITQVVVAVICLAVLGGILTVAAVAILGPQLAPLMKYLPW